MTVRKKGSVETAVRLSIRMGELKGQDKATGQLALKYAEEIDSGSDVTKVGPLLLVCLEALLMSPRARALAVKGVTKNDNSKPSTLDELRERRVRKNRTANLDSTAG